MSDPQTFADLLEQFNEQYVEFQNDYWGAIDRIVDMLNGALGSFADFVDDLLPGGGTIDDAVEKWNNELWPALRDGMEELQANVQEAVNDLAGNPGQLQIWAENYVTAQGMVFQQRNDVEIAADIAASWSGQAFVKYRAVSQVQSAHLQKLGDALEEGGKLTSDAALKILELWRKLIHEFASFYTDILNILASATDASKILSFEVPTVIEAIAKVWQKIVDITDILLEFMTGQATTDTINWLAMDVSAGGLAGNEWPSISENASDAMNDPGAWTPQSA